MNSDQQQIVTFVGQEYWSDTIHRPAHYTFIGSEDKGWQILRNGEHSLTLGPGFTLVKTRLPMENNSFVFQKLLKNVCC
jgi:hypothetical protein